MREWADDKQRSADQSIVFVWKIVESSELSLVRITYILFMVSIISGEELNERKKGKN